MKWILIYFLAGPSPYSAPTTNSVDFVTREACQVAGEAIKAEFPAARYICAPEGEAP